MCLYTSDSVLCDLKISVEVMELKNYNEIDVL